MSTMVAANDNEVAIEFHAGEALWSFATTYPTLPLCLIEAVQNAIDANAHVVFVGVDLVERRVAICDDGDGATRGQMSHALGSVGKGVKSSDKIGRFGRGFIAPLPMAQTMTVYSRARGESHINYWLLIGEQLRKMERNLKIPYAIYEDFPSLPFPFTHSHNEAKVGKRATRWSTMILLDRLIDDKALTTIDPEDFELLLLGKLRRPMREKNVTVFLKVRDRSNKVKTRKITATNFTGEKLNEVKLFANASGDVVLSLYKARMSGGKRSGRVEFFQDGDPSSIGAKEFRAQAMGLGWYGGASDESIKNGIDALCSGFFEGGVSVQNIELHPERKKFENGDALTDLYALIGDWYEKVGNAYLNDDHERRTEKRYQELGARSLEWLLSQLDTPEFAELRRNLQGIVSASSSSERTGEEQPKKPTERTKSPRSRRVVVRPRPEAKEEEPQQTRRGSFSLSFAYEMLSGSTRLWEYDHQEGVITFNIRHPLWVKVDSGKQSPKTDRRVVHTQSFIGFKIIFWLATHEDPGALELHRYLLDQEVEYYIEGFVLKM